MDGNFGGTLSRRLQAADTVILLDLPAWLCLLRIFKRVAFGRGRTRPDMASGCPERFDLAFIHYVWRFRKHKRPKLLARLEQCTVTTIILHSPAEVAHLLHVLPGK